MHTGKVVSMTPQTTTVQIVSHAACSQCHAAGVCGLSEYTEKAIEVPTSPSAAYASLHNMSPQMSAAAAAAAFC